MTLLHAELSNIENHWAINSLDTTVKSYSEYVVDNILIEKALNEILKSDLDEINYDYIHQTASAYEIIAIEGLDSLVFPSEENKEKRTNSIAGAYKAFSYLRVLPLPVDIDERIYHVLHLAGLAYVGDRWTDLQRWIDSYVFPDEVVGLEDTCWNKRIVRSLYTAWISLFRKSSWDDLNQISSTIIRLREEQSYYEKEFLVRFESGQKQVEAVRLVALYHWAKATEKLSTYMLQGSPVSIQTELDQYFEAAIKAAHISRDNSLEILLKWLHVSSKKMVDGSIWWVAHSLNPRIASFVENITRNKGMFELLPPQRVALQEQNLLDPAAKAIVVDMPTSGGKTQLAQFRILQALNQFSNMNCWIAYVAPTRALVSQITRRLRSDFSPLGIKIEQLTGAIEIDAFEESLLEKEDAFQVLVCTPEKLQLVIRNKKIKRPLVLLVMDEAHNLEDEERGLRIELLLATIKQENELANFLLLMPFVPNSKDLAQWLGSGRGRSISLSTSVWQPNERLIGLFYVDRVTEQRGAWKLKFESLVTTQKTLHLSGQVFEIEEQRPLSLFNYSTMNNSLSKQAVAMAKVFSTRGTSIAVAQKIPDVWRIARTVAEELDDLDPLPIEIQLVQRFLQQEVSPNFELIGMLNKGVAVHHAGLPFEVLSLIEWLTEEGFIKILCATTTIAQGLNFPVSSVFLATNSYPYGKRMSAREFWNLAGRAGRIGHDSVGVVGIAAGANPTEIREFVSNATGEIISRLTTMLDDLQSHGELNNLESILQQEQWADFRSYIAHLWNEKRNLDEVIANAEQMLRNTYGFSSLRSKKDPISQQKADSLLAATRNYVEQIAEHPENASLADATGFSPEGVRAALLELRKLPKNLSVNDWQPESLFGVKNKNSALPDLMGVMMKIPQLQHKLEDIAGSANIPSKRLAEITKAWVEGMSLDDIAGTYFCEYPDETLNLSQACRAIYRDLTNCGAWGLSALSKMPTSGIDFDSLGEEQIRILNTLPAMIYHGVKTEEAVLMRMNSVPRSIAESLGREYKTRNHGQSSANLEVKEFINSLSSNDWQRHCKEKSYMSGEDYKSIWKQLSGN